jgi:hypothetical protein
MVQIQRVLIGILYFSIIFGWAPMIKGMIYGSIAQSKESDYSAIIEPLQKMAASACFGNSTWQLAVKDLAHSSVASTYRVLVTLPKVLLIAAAINFTIWILLAIVILARCYESYKASRAKVVAPSIEPLSTVANPPAGIRQGSTLPPSSKQSLLPEPVTEERAAEISPGPVGLSNSPAQPEESQRSLMDLEDANRQALRLPRSAENVPLNVEPPAPDKPSEAKDDLAEQHPRKQNWMDPAGKAIEQSTDNPMPLQ